MDRYKLIIDDEKIFPRLFEQTNLNLNGCTLREVIVSPEENIWQITVLTDKNFDKQILRDAEEFLRQKYGAEVEIKNVVSAADEVIQAEKKSPPAGKVVSGKGSVESGKRSAVSKKISGDVIKIGNINREDIPVTVIGEVGEGEMNGVKLREFKNGTIGVSFCITDDTNGIVCKKFFKADKKADAQPFADSLKAGSLVKIAATPKYDDYAKEIVLFINAIEPVEKNPAREDIAEVKRVELHVHTQMSAMDAVIPVEKLIKTAADWNWNAVAITDHGVIQAFPNAAITAEKLAKAGKKIKIIYGMEGYLVGEDFKQKFANHVIILAKNKVGLANLYKLISISQIKYMYYRPRIPKSLLNDLRDGLIIGSACEAGELIRAIVAGKDDSELEEIANFYDYLEIQPIQNNRFLINSEEFPNITNDEDLRNINLKVVELAKKLGKPIVATTDAHFLNREDYICRAVLMASKGYEDADDQPPLYLRTTNEMFEEFDYLDDETAYEAIVTNPNKIAESVEFLKPIPDGLYSPQVPGAEEEIRETSYKKARHLYGENLPPLVEARLEQELKPIIAHGFAGLYLIAQRLVKKSNDDGYLVGSRGSVGSSFVATLTGITEVNPLPPHYRCPKCKYSKFFTKGEVGCGYDLENKNCPVCGHPLIKDGHDIPFAVFLGFDGDKVPDIDLNFSGEYQATAHKYTEVLFGKHNVYRAGTISTVADKTSFGFVKKYYEDRNQKKHGSFIAKIAAGCMGVKRTTGQHPAGITRRRLQPGVRGAGL